MNSVVISISSLLSGFSVLLIGAGLLNTLLGVRAGLEGFSDAVIGLIMSGYFVGFILGTYYCPGIIQRVGHIRAFAAMAAIGATSAFAHVLMVDPVVWLLLRIITGVSLVGMYMVVESWINTVAPDNYRSRLFATYMMITLIAVAIGPYLIIIDGGKGTISFGIAAMLFSMGLLPIVLTKVSEPKSIPVPRLNLRSIFKMSPSGIVGATSAGLANSAFLGMGAVFAQRINLDEQGIAIIMSMLMLGGACLQWPIGNLSDRWTREKALSAICLFATIAAVAAFFVANYSHAFLFLIIFVYGGMAFTVYPVSVALINDHIADENFLDVARSILLMYGIGAVLGPVIAGLSMHYFGPDALLFLIALIYLFTSIYSAYQSIKKQPLSPETHTSFTPMVRTSQAALSLHPEANQQASRISNPDINS